VCPAYATLVLTELLPAGQILQLSPAARATPPAADYLFFVLGSNDQYVYESDSDPNFSSEKWPQNNPAPEWSS